jgi:hypothetical protein
MCCVELFLQRYESFPILQKGDGGDGVNGMDGLNGLNGAVVVQRKFSVDAAQVF